MTSDEAQFIRRLNSALPRTQRRSIPHEGSTPTEPTAGFTATIEVLQKANNRDYSQEVNSHLGREHDSFWSLYLEPRLIRRTHAALLRKRAVTLRILEEYRSVNSRSRQKTHRVHEFLQLVEQRLQQVEEIVSDDAFTTQKIAIRKAVAAIREHCEATQRNNVQAEAWDERLWSVLDEIDTNASS